MRKGRSQGDYRDFSPAQKKHQQLPHLNIKNHYPFITFRTYDSVDAYLRKLTKKALPNRQ